MSLEAELAGTARPAGVGFRYLAGEADYAGMLAVRGDSAAHDGIDIRSSREGLPTIADLRANFAVREGSENPDVLIVTAAGGIVGYAHTAWRWTEASGVRVYLHLGYLLPAWRGRGIGQAMLCWCQTRLRSLAQADGADARAKLATNASTTERETTALVRHAGYVAIRSLADMAAPTAAATGAPLPAAIEIRPVADGQHRAIYRAMKDAHSDLPLSRAESEEDYREFLTEHVEEPDFDPTLWRIAWAGEEAVGLVIARVHAGAGHIAQVGVRRGWRRRGLARALLLQTLAALHDRGIAEARLYTDAADGQGARSLYASVGFRELKQHILYRRPLRAD